MIKLGIEIAPLCKLSKTQPTMRYARYQSYTLV